MLDWEFLKPAGLLPKEGASGIGADSAIVAAVIAGDRRMNAELDLRPARYFGMPAGLFLTLQIDYELLEARRTLGVARDRIVPRAA